MLDPSFFGNKELFPPRLSGKGSLGPERQRDYVVILGFVGHKDLKCHRRIS